MTEETIQKVELTEEEIKREKRRIYQREYMRRRREDPDFAEKQRAIVRNIATKKYHTDIDYKNKKTEYNQQYYQKYKDAYKEVRLALKK